MWLHQFSGSDMGAILLAAGKMIAENEIDRYLRWETLKDYEDYMTVLRYWKELYPVLDFYGRDRT